MAVHPLRKSQIQVDHNVPIPPKKGRWRHYFEALVNRGNSTLIPFDNWDSTSKNKTYMSISSSAHYRFLTTGIKYSASKEAQGVRIWRL